MTQENPFSPYRGLYKVQSAAIDSNLSAAQEREATRWVLLGTPDSSTVEITEYALRTALITHRLRTKEPFARNQRPKLAISSRFEDAKDGEAVISDRFQSGKEDESVSEFRLKELQGSRLISLAIRVENRHFKEHQRLSIAFTLKHLSVPQVLVLRFFPFLGRFL